MSSWELACCHRWGDYMPRRNYELNWGVSSLGKLCCMGRQSNRLLYSMQWYSTSAGTKGFHLWLMCPCNGARTLCRWFNMAVQYFREQSCSPSHTTHWTWTVPNDLEPRQWYSCCLAGEQMEWMRWTALLWFHAQHNLTRQFPLCVPFSMKVCMPVLVS